MFTTTNITKWSQGFGLDLNGMRYLGHHAPSGTPEDVDSLSGTYHVADATGVPYPEVTQPQHEFAEAVSATMKDEGDDQNTDYYPEGYGWGV